MKNKKKKILVITSVMITASIYNLLTPMKLGRDFFYKIENVIDTRSEVMNFSADGYYKTAGEIGYYNIKNSSMVHRRLTEDDYLVEGNSIGYAVYKKYGMDIELYSNRGNLIKAMSSPTYPYMPSDWPVAYFVKSNASGFSSYLLTGDMLVKEHNSNSMITSISNNKLLSTAVTFIDGKALLIDRDNQIVLTAENNLSEISVAKAAAVTEDGKYFSVITGVNPEVMTVYDTSTRSIVRRFETGNDIRYSPLIKTIDDRIYYETVNGISYFDINDKRLRTIDYRGELLEIDVSAKKDVLILSKYNGIYYLYIYNSKGVRTYYNEYTSEVSNARFSGEHVFVYKFENYIVINRPGVDT